MSTVTGNLRLDLWEGACTRGNALVGMGVFVLVKEVPFHQGQVGSKCSSSLAQCVTPPSHQHPILCDPPSHGATRPAVLPGPGQRLQCPVYRPASCLAAGMPSPVPAHLPQHYPGFSHPQNTSFGEAYPLPLPETFTRGHFVDRLVSTTGDSGLHNATK